MDHVLHERHTAWLGAREIDPELATKFGLTTTNDAGGNWLTLPYVERGRVVNHKYRITSDKSRQRMDKDAPLTLFNHDALLDDALNDHPLIITEGEFDCMIAVGCGKLRSVSVPNGAPKTESASDELVDGKRYAWFWRHRDLLERAKKVILAVDNDEPGRALGSDLARLFGPERCFFVRYPDGCKDLNDVQMVHGPAQVAALLDAAKPYPVKGLYQMEDFPDAPEYERLSTGLPELDTMFQIVPRTFTVCTGFAGQGKTTVMLWIVANLMARGIHVTIASFETDVKPILRRKLRAHLAGVGEFSPISYSRLAEIDAMINDNLSIIAHSPSDDDDELALEDVLDLARVAVVRNNSRVLIIDPWNELEHKRKPGETETEYTGRAIRSIKRFTKVNNLATWMIAHPKKPFDTGKAPTMPSLYDISGSSNWANKADYGIVVHAKNRDLWLSTVAVVKVRMGLPGKQGKMTLSYNPRTSQFAHFVELDEGADA